MVLEPEAFRVQALACVFDQRQPKGWTLNACVARQSYFFRQTQILDRIIRLVSVSTDRGFRTGLRQVQFMPPNHTVECLTIYP
jgi:hypothetical protein